MRSILGEARLILTGKIVGWIRPQVAGPSLDACGSSDEVSAGIETTPTPPSHPCPKCGAETKDANSGVTRQAGHAFRRCSAPSCRKVADWSSGSPVSFEGEIERDPETVTEEELDVLVDPHSCPMCGKASKDNNTTESVEAGQDLRICASRLCRYRFDAKDEGANGVRVDDASTAISGPGDS